MLSAVYQESQNLEGGERDVAIKLSQRSWIKHGKGNTPVAVDL